VNRFTPRANFKVGIAIVQRPRLVGGRPEDRIVSERCLAVFESLDFVLEACADVGRGALPPELARTLERTLAEGA